MSPGPTVSLEREEDPSVSTGLACEAQQPRRQKVQGSANSRCPSRLSIPPQHLENTAPRLPGKKIPSQCRNSANMTVEMIFTNTGVFRRPKGKLSIENKRPGSGFAFISFAVVQELSTHASPTKETPETHPTSIVNCERVLLLGLYKQLQES